MEIIIERNNINNIFGNNIQIRRIPGFLLSPHCRHINLSGNDCIFIKYKQQFNQLTLCP